MKQPKRYRVEQLVLRKYGDNDEVTASLSWSNRGLYPRISVFTSSDMKDGKNFDYGKLITAPFTYEYLAIFFNLFKKVIDSKEEIQYEILCYNNKFQDNKRLPDIILQAKVLFGKDKDGVIYMGAIEEGKRSVKFELLPNSKWHLIAMNNEVITDKRILSEIYAISYLETLKAVYGPKIKEDLFKEANDTSSDTNQFSNAFVETPTTTSDGKKSIQEMFE